MTEKQNTSTGLMKSATMTTLHSQNEQLFIGCLLADPTLFPIYNGIDELFTDVVAKSIYEKMKVLFTKYKGFDPVSLCVGWEMTEYGMYMAAAMAQIPGSHMIGFYHDEMIQVYRKNILTEAFRLSQELVEEGDIDTAKQVTIEAQAKVDRYVNSAPEDHLSQWFTRLCSAYDDKNKPKIYLGFPTLDRYLGAMLPGQMHVLGARPKVGKSLVATNIAVNIAKKGYGVLYFSLEMSIDQMLSRAVACFSRSVSVTTSQNLTEANISQISAGLADFAQLPLWFACGVFSVQNMESTIHKYRSEGKRIDFVIVDYLQLIKGDGRKSRYEQVTDISTGIKRLAMSEELPILALSQLSRDSADGEPKVHHLRESGSIEQDAESIMLLWRPSEEDPTVQLLLRGNRNGDSYANIALDFDYNTLSVHESSRPTLYPQTTQKVQRTH